MLRDDVIATPDIARYLHKKCKEPMLAGMELTVLCLLAQNYIGKFPQISDASLKLLATPLKQLYQFAMINWPN
jgi:hypothetical protein